MRGVLGLLQASHPFPLLAVVCLTALIGVASAGHDVDGARLARVLLAMLLAQFVIGWTNDYTDRDADARYQPDKPVPAGRVDARLLAIGAAVGGLAALVLAATLGAMPALYVAVGMLCGLAYNFGLKSTAASWVPFVVAFCVLPPFVWTGLDVWQDVFMWLYLFGLPLTVAAHLANTLPDIETDRASGRESIVVRLGRNWTLRLLLALLAIPALLTLMSTRWLAYDGSVLAATLAAYGVVAVVAGGVYMLGGGRRDGDVWGFRLVVVLSLLFVTGWLASVK